MYISKIFLTVDCVIIKKIKINYGILLIKRKNDPFKDFWALPGGFVDENEDLKEAAIRELFEETSVEVLDLEQIGAFGKPFRDPRSHVVSVAYYGEVSDNITIKANDDAKEANWFPIDDLPSLAFDHKEIISKAIMKFLNINI